MASWQGVKVIELETHPVWSTVPRNVQTLSDGSEMWDYANCRTRTEDVQCTSARGWAPGTVRTNCSGGGSSTVCCHNQFFVRDGVVEAYRPTGRCFTDCRVRPGATC